MTDAGTILGIDIGGTKVAAALVDLGDQPTIKAHRSISTQPELGRDHLLASVSNLAVELIGASVTPVTAVGIGSAGVIDSASGCVISATDLIPGWAGAALGPTVATPTGLPIAVTGDVLAHALGENVYGAGIGQSSCLVVGVGTGVGGALVADGQVRSGEHGLAGHFGHFGHHLARDLVCSCGRRGHLEPVASGTGIASEYQRLTGVRLNSRDVAEAAERGDSAALAVIQAAGRSLGEVLAGLTKSWDPAIIIVSGSVANAGEFWWQSLRQGFASQAMDLVSDTPLVKGRLGGDAPLLGAAHFAKNRFF